MKENAILRRWLFAFATVCSFTAAITAQDSVSPLIQYRTSYGHQLQTLQRGASPPIQKDGLGETVTAAYRAVGCEIEATLPRQTKTGNPIVLKVKVSNHNDFDLNREAFGGIPELRIIVVDEKLMSEPFVSDAPGSEQRFLTSWTWVVL